LGKNGLRQCNANQIPLALKKQAALAAEDTTTSLNPVAHVLKFQVSNHPHCWVKQQEDDNLATPVRK